jgi:glycerol-3-phosphate dehydrogenase
VTGLAGDGAEVHDELTGATASIAARAVVNATGVWAAALVPEVTLRPSRGTHLVLRSSSLGGLSAAVMAPVPGERNRYVFALPQADGRTYVGLTDEPVDAVPDVPEPIEHPVRRADVVGAFAGLRPLLDAGGRTADLSRRHAVLTSRSGVITVVGGKLTTYRRMAQDAVDAAVRGRALEAAPCRTRQLAAVGAASPAALAQIEAPARLVRRYGTEAGQVLRSAQALTGQSEAELLAPVADGVPVTRAELLWGTTHEGALDVDDLLDRRTRIGLVAADRAAAVGAAREALQVLSSTAGRTAARGGVGG